MRNLSEKKPSNTIIVKRTGEFNVTGDGTSQNWESADWVLIPQRSEFQREQQTQIKLLYSYTGIYFLFSCEASEITATYKSDFADLWKEDVVEVFLWPDEKTPAYFEYEISPLNYELPILISNQDGDLTRWRPFHYDSDRRTHHATHIQKAYTKNGSLIIHWTAEFFIPFKLLRPLQNTVPKQGLEWKANFYRMDYGKSTTKWAWKEISQNFHEMDKFGTLLFD